MSESPQSVHTVDLGSIEPARSRHMWTRSSVAVTDSHAIVGQWDGTITAIDRETLDTAWEAAHADSPATLTTHGSSVIAAGRGDAGTIAAYAVETGDSTWSYATAEDIGAPTSDRVFEQPYVVDCVTAGDQFFAAARRYERGGDHRRWHSTVYAFDSTGDVAWRYSTDGSPIALDSTDDASRLAVGYNRCMGDHDQGLVVLDTATGEAAWTWDPGTAGDRRVGDVSFDGDQLAVTSHGDKRGYLLGSDGGEQWGVDLAVPTEIDGETLYAYPNHAHAHDGRVAFLTGNTYPAKGRETEGRHPNEHRIVGVDSGGTEQWAGDLGGFVHGVAAADSRLVVPTAQNFRERDAATHACRAFDLSAGETAHYDLQGIATAAAVADNEIAVVEEPIVYHDEGEKRGSYRLHLVSS